MIQVDEMHLKITGKTSEDGITLGKLVAERLAESIPEYSVNKHIPELRVQLHSSSTNDTIMLADRIVEQIVKQIKLET